MKRRKKASQFPVAIVVGGFLLLAAALTLGMVNRANRPEAVQPTDQPQSAGDIPYPEVERVSLADAKASYDSGTALFLDVRSPSSYAESHIPGAVSIPLTELAGRLTELDPGDWIMTYCT